MNTALSALNALKNLNSIYNSENDGKDIEQIKDIILALEKDDIEAAKAEFNKVKGQLDVFHDFIHMQLFKNEKKNEE